MMQDRGLLGQAEIAQGRIGPRPTYLFDEVHQRGPQHLHVGDVVLEDGLVEYRLRLPFGHHRAVVAAVGEDQEALAAAAEAGSEFVRDQSLYGGIPIRDPLHKKPKRRPVIPTLDTISIS